MTVVALPTPTEKNQASTADEAGRTGSISDSFVTWMMPKYPPFQADQLQATRMVLARVSNKPKTIGPVVSAKFRSPFETKHLDTDFDQLGYIEEQPDTEVAALPELQDFSAEHLLDYSQDSDPDEDAVNETLMIVEMARKRIKSEIKVAPPRIDPIRVIDDLAQNRMLLVSDLTLGGQAAWYNWSSKVLMLLSQCVELNVRFWPAPTDSPKIMCEKMLVFFLQSPAAQNFVDPGKYPIYFAYQVQTFLNCLVDRIWAPTRGAR